MHRYMLDRPIKEIPKEEIIKLLGHLKISELMRTIILNERDFQKVREHRSIRQFWYTHVKVALEKLGKLDDEQTEDNLTKWDSELSRYLAQLVRQGELTYSDLKIMDTSREKNTPGDSYLTTNSSAYGYQVGSGHYSNIILSTEKNTAYGIIANIAAFFGCSCISGKGQNSLAAMEQLLNGIADHHKEIYILTMTDYDPSGYFIADTFRNQVEDLQQALDRQYNVTVERIGIFPAQLTDEEISQNKYTPKKQNRDKWFQKTGGINGEPKGLELDALEPERIRGLFVTSLKKYINPVAYIEVMKKAYLKKLILEALKADITEVSQDIMKQEYSKVVFDDTDIFELAEKGYGYLPVEQLCYIDDEDDKTEIAEKAITALREAL